jgi:thiol-disulfide isomerase/thioredoxin
MSKIYLYIFILVGAASLSAQEFELKAGDAAPELLLFKEDGQKINIDSIDANYFLLIFWHYKCSHCQKSLSKIDKFLADEKPKGLKIISIYPFAEETEKFWSYVKDPLNQLTDPTFVHFTDPKAATRRSFSQKAGQPPLLILLDKSAKIVQMHVKAAELKNVWKQLH